MKLVNKPLFKLERRNSIVSFILFSLIVGAICFVTIALYPVLKDAIEKLITEGDLGELENLIKMDSITEYFTSNMFQMWGLLGIIYASVLAVKLTSANFKDGSYEMLYTLNISRGQIVRTKLVRLLLNLTYFTLIVALFNYAGLAIFVGFSAFSTPNFLLYTLVMWLITLIVGALAFALGLASKRKFGVASAVVLGIVFYLIVTISEAAMVDWIGYLSPLTLSVSNVLQAGAMALSNNWYILVIWGAVAGISLWLSTLKFKNDDLC